MKKLQFLILGTILFGGLNAQLEARSQCYYDCQIGHHTCDDECRKLFKLGSKNLTSCYGLCTKVAQACDFDVPAPVTPAK